MKNNTWIWIVIAIIILVIVAYSTGQGLNNSRELQSNNIATSSGSDSLCSQGAQIYANSLNQSALQLSQSSNIPSSSYFLVISHYAVSKDTCYFELHYQIPFPPKYGGISDDYALDVTSGLSKYLMDNKAVGATEVADCATQQNTNNTAANNSTTCHYYDPVEKPGSGGFSYWVPQYSPNNAPPMSQQDFQSLVQRDMVSN